MEAFYDQLIVRAATIDELLSDAFEPLHGQKGDTDLAARRLAAWCRSSASGDWTLFERRLARDGWSIVSVLERLGTVRRTPSEPPPWVNDAMWIEAALQRSGRVHSAAGPEPEQTCAFEPLLLALVEQAEQRLWADLHPQIGDHLADAARACLRTALLRDISVLLTPAYYQRFTKARSARSDPSGAGAFRDFIDEMNSGGVRRLFDEKPVLLRLIATVTRQWIDTTREFLLRLDADRAAIGQMILRSGDNSRVVGIEGAFSDPHNDGRSVQIVRFENGSRAVYKPKDLRIDLAWHDLVERLNHADPPLQLKAVRTLARDGYGWTEYIAHTGCADQHELQQFFRRGGAWLALLHCFAATDMHQENMIAAGEHPVPIDLETILHATSEDHVSPEPEDQAFAAAMETIANSVATVGLLPAYGRSPDNNVFAVGGMTADWNSRTVIRWQDINTDAMRPVKVKETSASVPNLPHLDHRYAAFGDYLADFIAGFDDYAHFLLRCRQNVNDEALFDGFAGLPVRKVVRPTRFYYMLLQRLKNHQTMDDGVTWSAQADFVTRLSEWQKDTDAMWPLRRAERAALLALNVPHFVMASDGDEIRDSSGIAVRTDAKSGMARAKAHLNNLNERDIAWQIDVIRQNTSAVSRSDPASTAPKPAPQREPRDGPAAEIFIAEADRIAAEISDSAIRRGPGAAWIGLDWVGDSEVFQLIRLGPDLYNGVCGIAVFLAAHAAVRENAASAELAVAALSQLRKSLKSRNAARLARSLGIGGATGLGSIIYALALTANLLKDDGIRADSVAAAALFTSDLIAADTQLDVIGGSAGAILGLLRLYRDTGNMAVLQRAVQCGDHLLGQRRVGSDDGPKSWVGKEFGAQALNGMSHGASGFAYALASLAQASHRQDFADAASECLAFEAASFDPARGNWPDRRVNGQVGWPCQWCHGATGIGLARVAMAKRGATDFQCVADDIGNAVKTADLSWPGQVDTLCCGTLGNVEFFREAGEALSRPDLAALAARRLLAVIQNAASTGDFRWNGGKRQFNLGLFRGLAGVGYTLLRQAKPSLPNVLIWE